MMKESHAKQRYNQCRKYLLMFFHNNEHKLEKNNNEKVVRHIQKKYYQNDINTKERHEKVVGVSRPSTTRR